MRLRIVITLAAIGIALSASAQDQPQAKQPQVRINYLNVCTPSEDEQKEMALALALIPLKPAFASDFEISRGRSTLTQAADEANPNGPEKATVSRWVRIRHEFTNGPFNNAQYSFSVDEQEMTETLVFHARDLNKGIVQISLQDTVTTGTPAQVLAANTPPDRIRIERNGKSSIVLARCPAADQAKYEALFHTGSEILGRYRSALRVKQTVPADLARVAGTGTETKKPSSGAKK